MAFSDRVKNAWNAFANKDPTKVAYRDIGIYGGSSYRPDRMRFTRGNERSIVTTILNRIAVDAASVDIKHVRLDSNNRYLETIDSPLNECLTVEANVDQTGRAFIQDAVQSMLDEGCVALVPTILDGNPDSSEGFKIYEMRVGKIVEWYPRKVKVSVYNEDKGKQQEIIVSKKTIAIVENPFFSVMNEPNSTMQRLIRKLSLLDYVDEQTGAGKLDLIIQLPYQIKTEARRNQAETRRKDIEMQLQSSKYGIAYTDGTEHITQLNRSVDNQLMSQIENLTRMLYSQLGIDETILNGTANDETMNNYYTRIIEVILSALVEAMRCKFISKTARTQHQSIMFFRDSFKLIPLTKIGDLANSLIRNEVLTTNEFRQRIGITPSPETKADSLRNPNMPDNDGDGIPDEQMSEEEYNAKMAELDEFDSQLDELEKMIGGGESDE